MDVCLQTCAVAADCATPSAPYDDDNYACDAGACVYTGCNSDAECEDLGDYACESFEGGLDLCVLTCDTPADCDGGSAAYDEDNYACESGLCAYTGCNSDQECQDTAPNLVCHG
jgi:hypothetical protein